MTLSERQRLFARLFADLISWAYAEGYEVVINEVARTPEQQQIYVQQGKSRTRHSLHLKRLAGDLLLFVDGVYQRKTEVYAPLGAYWRQLHPACRWGGDWSRFPDGGHFELLEREETEDASEGDPRRGV